MVQFAPERATQLSGHVGDAQPRRSFARGFLNVTDDLTWVKARGDAAFMLYVQTDRGFLGGPFPRKLMAEEDEASLSWWEGIDRVTDGTSGLARRFC